MDAKSGAPAVPHGLRASFRTWVGERTTFDSVLAEVALFHTVGSKTEQTYARSDMVEKRRSLMTAWGDFLGGRQAANLVKLVEVR